MYEVSTGSFSPFWIINGPIRKELNINGGLGALSPGDMANATMGRAMGLIIKNIWWREKRCRRHGYLGSPGKYSMVMGRMRRKAHGLHFIWNKVLIKRIMLLQCVSPNDLSQVSAYRRKR